MAAQGSSAQQWAIQGMKVRQRGGQSTPPEGVAVVGQEGLKAEVA